MKKRILSLIFSVAVASSVFASMAIVHAEDAATFEVVTDLADTTNVKAGDTFNVSVQINGIENLVAYNSKKGTGTGLSSAQFVLFVPDNDFVVSGSETVPANTTPNWVETTGGYYIKVAFAGAAGNMIAAQPYTLVTVDMEALKDITEPQEFKVVALDDFACKTTRQVFENKVKTAETEFNSKNGNLVLGSVTVGGSSTPPEPDKFEAKVDNDSGEITFENADLSTDNKEIGGKAIKIFGKEFTVKADSTSKFVITYDQDGKNETKTFGKTAAEYLGIEGKGDAEANVTIGIIYDKASYNADDFKISVQ